MGTHPLCCVLYSLYLLCVCIIDGHLTVSHKLKTFDRIWLCLFSGGDKIDVAHCSHGVILIYPFVVHCISTNQTKYVEFVCISAKLWSHIEILSLWKYITAPTEWCILIRPICWSVIEQVVAFDICPLPFPILRSIECLVWVFFFILRHSFSTKINLTIAWNVDYVSCW